jgi:hypothetical protein
MAAKIKATINFTAKTLTIEKWGGIVSTEQLIFWIVDPLGTTIYINTGYNAPDFSSPDIDEATSDTLVVSLPLDDNDLILQGTYTLNHINSVSGSGSKYTTGIATVTYCLTVPTVNVGLEYSCRSAELTSTDNTEYDIYCPCSASDITPSITRTHTVSYPKTMETPIADIVDTGATITTPDLWTKLWVSKISSALVYRMPRESYTGSIAYNVAGTVAGLSSINVVCEQCLCNLYTCISALVTKYELALSSGNDKDIAKYNYILMLLHTYHMQYYFAEGCGTEEDVRAICGKIQNLIGLWDCTCSTTNTEQYSIEVIPVTAGSGTTVAGTNIYNGDGVPSVSLGSNGDFYFNNLNGDVYKKVTGAWVLQFTMGITALLSNHLLGSDNTTVISFLNVYTELKSYEFDVTDVQDGSVLVVSGNLRIDEPTGDDTAIRVNLVGTATDSTIIPVDAAFGATFPINIEIEYYIKEVAGTLTVVGKMWKLTTPSGIALFDKSIIAIPLQATLTPNEINFLVKSDDNITSIYLDNSRINHLRTV